MLLNENCLSTMDLMPEGSVDMVLTSPPYDNLRKYNGFVFEFDKIAKELFRVVKTGGVVVWVVGDATVKCSETGTSFKQALKFMELGFNLHDTMIYAKNNYIHLTHNRYEQEFEYMFVLSKGKLATFNPIKIPCKTAGQSYNLSRKGYCKTITEGAQRRRDKVVVTAETKIKGNIFYYSLGAAITSHPASFPEQLAEDHILTWSNPGDTVYDPFAGSGTVAKMCIKNGRNWIASEISPEYCEIINKRLQTATI